MGGYKDPDQKDAQTSWIVTFTTFAWFTLKPLWLLFLTFSCSAEPVNFNSTCSLLWLFVPCVLLLLLSCSRLLQLSACDSGCGPSATAGAVWTGQSGHLASVSGWNVPWPWPWLGTPLWGLGGRGGCGGGGGGWWLSRCSVGGTGGWYNVDVTSPAIHCGWGGHGHQGTQRACGCASLEVTKPDRNHTVSLYLLSGFLCTQWFASATRQPSLFPRT